MTQKENRKRRGPYGPGSAAGAEWLQWEQRVTLARRSGHSWRRPGDWWILDAPECHLHRDTEVLVPDVAGWRRERLLPLANREARLQLRGRSAPHAYLRID